MSNSAVIGWVMAAGALVLAAIPAGFAYFQEKEMRRRKFVQLAPGVTALVPRQKKSPVPLIFGIAGIITLGLGIALWMTGAF